jgi:hypothetical protein
VNPNGSLTLEWNSLPRSLKRGCKRFVANVAALRLIVVDSQGRLWLVEEWLALAAFRRQAQAAAS